VKINQTPAQIQNKGLSAKEKKVKAQDQQEVQDKVTLGDKVKHSLKEAAEFPLGAVGAVVGGVTNVIPGAFEGAPRAIDTGDRQHGLEVGHVLQGVALGTVGGVLLDSVLPGGKVWGGVIGGAVGAGVSLARLGLYHTTDSDKNIKDGIGETVDRLTSDNVQTKDDDVHDGVRDLVEGAGIGLVAGGIEGTKTGYYEGKGVTAGIGHGLKGAKDVILGNYPQVEGEKTKLTAGKVLGKIVKAPVSLASGLIGAVSTLPTGTIHGIKAGVKLAEGEELRGYDLRKAEKSAALWTKLGTVGLGAAAGAIAVGGPWGIGGGIAAGLVGAAIVHKLQKTGEGDKEIARGILNAVNYAHSDNVDTGNKAYDGYRDVIESVFVGPLAGLREGFRVGYIGADAAQDGVFEVVKELVHKSPEQPAKPEQEISWEEKERMDSAYPFGIQKPEKPEAETAEITQAEEQTKPEEKPSYEKPVNAEAHKKSGIRKAVEAVGGGLVGAGSTVVHTAAGTVEGTAEGLRDRKFADKDPEYRHPKTGLFTFANVATLTAASGATAYLLGGGPVVTAIAAGGGLIAGIALRAFEGDEGTDKLVEKIDLSVDEGLKDNKEGSKAFLKGQGLGEGAAVGFKAAAKGSWELGYDGGKKATGFGIDVGRGVMGGLKELGKDVIGMGPKKGEVEKDEN